VLAYWRLLADDYLISEASTCITLYVGSCPSVPTHVHTSMLLHNICTSCYLRFPMLLTQRSIILLGLLYHQVSYRGKQKKIEKRGYKSSQEKEIQKRHPKLN